MKIYMTNGLESSELPDGKIIEFVNRNGDKYKITALDDDSGINVRLLRKTGYDQMIIHPRMANDIYIR